MREVPGKVAAMSGSISGRLRNQAADICQAYASAPGCWTFSCAVAEFDVPQSAIDLARDAIYHVRSEHRDSPLGYADESVTGAEAEALLRTGWSP